MANTLISKLLAREDVDTRARTRTPVRWNQVPVLECYANPCHALFEVLGIDAVLVLGRFGHSPHTQERPHVS